MVVAPANWCGKLLARASVTEAAVVKLGRQRRRRLAWSVRMAPGMWKQWRLLGSVSVGRPSRRHAQHRTTKTSWQDDHPDHPDHPNLPSNEEELLHNKNWTTRTCYPDYHRDQNPVDVTKISLARCRQEITNQSHLLLLGLIGRLKWLENLLPVGKEPISKS